MAAGAYQNGTWVVGVAKGGVEEGVDSLAESQIIAPSGEVVAKAVTTGDEVIVAACDLDCLRQVQAHPVRLRPVPDARALRPDHHPTRRRPPTAA